MNGFDVRFTFNSTKATPSNISTNVVTANIGEYFAWESEFQSALEIFTLGYDGTGDVIRAVVSFNQPIASTTSSHVTHVSGTEYQVDTSGNVLLGKISFNIGSETVDTFDPTWFELETSVTNSPTTGIKINIDGVNCYEAQSTFRFTKNIRKIDADITDLVLSTGVKETSTYKEYSLTPIFNKDIINYTLELEEDLNSIDLTVTKSNASAGAKVKVPKRNENDELVYELDGSTIVYEEKALIDAVALNIELNKRKEPDTKLTVIVTAEDGTTTKTYNLTIKKYKGLSAEEGQYIELRAVDVKEVENGNNQLIMELWANDIAFEGFDVRFNFDNSKIKPSNITTNEETVNIAEYFEWEDEFKNVLEIFTLEYDGTENILRAVVSFNPGTITTIDSSFVKNISGTEYQIDASDGKVLLGKMSFNANEETEETFDTEWFELQTSQDISNKTGIKISIDGEDFYDNQSTFIFTKQFEAADADLASLAVSTDNRNYTLSPSFDKDETEYTVIYMEYGDTANVTVTKSDENASAIIKVPVRDEEGTITGYTDTDIEDGVPVSIELNKLGEEDTSIVITVTAEDGVTTKDYTVVVNRPYGTIRGQIETEPTKVTTKKNEAEVYVYSSEKTAEVIDWDDFISKTDTGKKDDSKNTLKDQILNIEEDIKVKTDEDGKFEIKVIPGKIDLIINKDAYLNYYYIRKTITKNDVIVLEDPNKSEDKEIISLVAGDLNGDGFVEGLDKTLVTKSNGAKPGDEKYNSKYDINDDEKIEGKDKTVVIKKNGTRRTIIDNEGGGN